MRIIHYMIGLPPFRHGGASKYALDLAIEQSKNNDVFLLIPGDTLRLGNYSEIISKGHYKNIPLFAILNPVVSPLLFGVNDPSLILNNNKKFRKAELDKFLIKTQPDIIHLHTLMGIPESLISFFKEKNIKIVFTSHDYYGICPKVNLFNYKGELCDGPNGIECAKCNLESKSNLFLKICNSDVFLKYKHLLPFKGTQFNQNKSVKSEKKEIPELTINKFELLFKYYQTIFAKIDLFHFNSYVAENTYKRFCQIKKSNVIPITTNMITDRRTDKNTNFSNVQLGFIGSINEYKGFDMLKSVLSELYNEEIMNFNLNVWEDGLTGTDKDLPLISYRGKYCYNQLKDVFSEMDLLIVPSIWKETFSLVTLEALSFGTPALLSKNVGAKIIVEEYTKDFIFSDSNELKLILKKVLNDNTFLIAYQKEILNKDWRHSMPVHSEQIIRMYSELIKSNC